MGRLAMAAELDQPARIIRESATIGDEVYNLAVQIQSKAALFDKIEAACEDEEDRLLISGREAALIERIRTGVTFAPSEKERVMRFFTAVFAE